MPNGGFVQQFPLWNLESRNLESWNLLPLPTRHLTAPSEDRTLSESDMSSVPDALDSTAKDRHTG